MMASLTKTLTSTHRLPRRGCAWCLVLTASLLALTSGCSRSSEQAAAAGQAVMEPPADLGESVHITRANDHLDLIAKVYDIDRIYKSMTGPWSRNDLQLLEGSPRELVWITGAHVEMVDAEAKRRMPEQFMCHANLDLNIEKHREWLGFEGYRDTRLFTLSQGQLAVQFPPGWGIPVMSDEMLELITQVLNLNDRDAHFQIRHHVKIDFQRDRDLKTPLKPLYESGVFGLVSLEGMPLAFDDPSGLLGNHSAETESQQQTADEHPEGKHQGTGNCPSCCLPGKRAVEEALDGIDRYGRKFAGHWVVKPGREVNRTRATTMLNLTEDSTIHFIAVHLHPLAESLELIDLTTGETVFKSLAQNLEGQIGLAHVDSFSSAEGVAVHVGHEYELVSTYNNTTDEDQDSMAVMYVYMHDKEFKKPELTVSAK